MLKATQERKKRMAGQARAGPGKAKSSELPPRKTPLTPPPAFPFPFTPYDIQRDMMRNLYTCFEAGGLGVFQSPTGTVGNIGACLMCAHTCAHTLFVCASMDCKGMLSCSRLLLFSSHLPHSVSLPPSLPLPRTWLWAGEITERALQRHAMAER